MIRLLQIFYRRFYCTFMQIKTIICIDSVHLPLLDIFGHKFAKMKVFFFDHTSEKLLEDKLVFFLYRTGIYIIQSFPLSIYHSNSE